MRWNLSSPDKNAIEAIAKELQIPSPVARVFAARGLTNLDTAYQFLHPNLDQLHDPFRMADMSEAVERIRRAIAQREKVLIYGDYDVDGAMASVVLLTTLARLGAQVETFIPHRFREGYGMSLPAVERAAAQGFRVIVTVDTGIREHEAIARAKALGLDCIVTDHHLPKETLPAATAVLNPRRSDCGYPDKHLSGVGVALKLAQALLGHEMSEALLRSYLKIVSIGTIADVAPLIGENRVFARFGLEGLREPRQPGLDALLKSAGLEGSEITAGDVGFRIAPRLNAAGRLDDAQCVIDLLTTQDARQAEAIALRLDGLNRDRQRIEDQMLREVLSEAERSNGAEGRFSLVFAGEGWHIGVIGIVAQRVAERFYRPTLIVSVANGEGRGSGRSIPGFNLFEALVDSGNLFVKFGGHAQAGGFTLPSPRIPELRDRFESYTRRVLGAAIPEPSVQIDAEIRSTELGWSLYNALKRMEPFGVGNPALVLMTRGLRIEAPPYVLKEKHLKLKLGAMHETFEAVAWNKAAWAKSLSAGRRVDVAFTLAENDYRGFPSLQLQLKDLRNGDEP